MLGHDHPGQEARRGHREGQGRDRAARLTGAAGGRAASAGQAPERRRQRRIQLPVRARGLAVARTHQARARRRASRGRIAAAAASTVGNQPAPTAAEQRRPRRPRPRSCRRSRSRHRGRRPGSGATAGWPSRRPRPGSGPGAGIPAPIIEVQAVPQAERDAFEDGPGQVPPIVGERSARRRRRARAGPGAGCARRSGRAGTAGRRSPRATSAAAATRSPNSTPGASASRNQRRLPAAESITDIMCQRPGTAWQKAWTMPRGSWMRAVGRGEDDARGPEREGHRARVDDADADRVGRLVAAAGDDRRARPQARWRPRPPAVTAPVTSGPSNVGGHPGGVDPERARGPRATSRGRRGRTGWSPRRRPCPGRTRRSAGAARSPWAGGRAPTRAQTSGSWSRTQTSFGAVKPGQGVVAGDLDESLRADGRPDHVALGGRALVVPEDRRAQDGIGPRREGRVRASGRSARPPRPRRPTTPVVGQDRPDRADRAVPPQLGRLLAPDPAGASRSRTRDAPTPTTTAGLVDEDGLGRGRRRVDADDMGHRVSGRRLTSPVTRRQPRPTG